MAQTGSLQDSIEYVRRLDSDCTLTDGYVCAEVDADEFVSAESLRRLVPGVYLQAWAACYQDFLRIPELSDEQKALHHYRIGFSEDAAHYIVLFNGLLLPRLEDGKPAGVLMAVFGRSARYWVDKASLRIVRREFLK